MNEMLVLSLLGIIIVQLCFVIFLLWVIGSRQYEIHKDKFIDRRKR